jgi:DNA-binding transcriptional LysR family regulator
MPLYTENYRVAVSASNKAVGKKLSLDIYCDKLSHILVSLDGAFSGTLDNALEALGRRRRVIATLPSFFPALTTVSKTDAAVTMPSRLVDAYGPSLGLRAFDPPLPVRSFEVMMAWHRRNDAEPSLEWLRAEILKRL